MKLEKYQNKRRHIDKWIKIVNPGINPYIYSQLIFNKGTNIIQLKGTVFPTSGVGIIVYPHVRKTHKPLTLTMENN